MVCKIKFAFLKKSVPKKSTFTSQKTSTKETPYVKMRTMCGEMSLLKYDRSLVCHRQQVAVTGGSPEALPAPLLAHLVRLPDLARSCHLSLPAPCLIPTEAPTEHRIHRASGQVHVD